MSKRKQPNQDKALGHGMDVDNESGSDEDFDMLDVDFEWFDPDPEIDFHGIKSLLQQLFDIDNQLFDISALTDLILSQPTLGSTVKVDGKDTDAYAFLSVVNLQEHKEHRSVISLTQYLKTKAASTPQLKPLQDLLSQSNVPAIGLILTDRLINCPSEIVPPMYTMLQEEIQWALEEKEPYNFTHYLILSKTYTEVASALSVNEDRPKKKAKSTSGAFETMYFHPEDEIFQRHAVCSGGFDYTTKQDDGHSDSKRAFHEMGIKPQAFAVLIEASKLGTAVEAVTEYLSSPN